MYVVTNREVYPRRKGLAVFGDTPNTRGPNELRIVEIVPSAAGYECALLPDGPLKREELRALVESFSLTIDIAERWYPSLRVACEIFLRAMREKRHVLAFVHDYNSNMNDVLRTADSLESIYNVVTVVFSWPANAGGFATPGINDWTETRDARMSSEALNRFFEKIALYHRKLTENRRDHLFRQAAQQFPDNPSMAQERYSELAAGDCDSTLNLVCHGIGCYVLQCALEPAFSMARSLIFDNVILVAADADNQDHAAWVERMQVRNRLYVTINERDSALLASRSQPGSQELQRLGSYRKNLLARNAWYIDVTRTAVVEGAHGYFVGAPVERNVALRDFFSAAFEGRYAEDALNYEVDSNAYRVP